MKKIISLFAIGALSAPALAAEVDNLYGSIGSGLYQLESDGFDETAATLKVLGGYSVTDNVAFEASYSRLFEASEVVDGIDVDIDGHVWDLSTKLSMPLGDRFVPYARLGWSYVDLAAVATEDGESERFNNYDNAFTWAVGTGVNLSRKLAINGELARSMIDGGDLDFLSVNMTYRFGAH